MRAGGSRWGRALTASSVAMVLGLSGCTVKSWDRDAASQTYGPLVVAVQAAVESTYGHLSWGPSTTIAQRENTWYGCRIRLNPLQGEPMPKMPQGEALLERVNAALAANGFPPATLGRSDVGSLYITSRDAQGVDFRLLEQGGVQIYMEMRGTPTACRQ